MGSRTIFIPKRHLLPRMLGRVRPFGTCLISLVLSLVLLLLIRILPARFIETVYSQTIFPKISYICGLISRHMPFSLAGALLWGLASSAVLAVLALPVLLWVLPRRLKVLALYARVVSALLVLILLLFAITCAPNYYRLTFAEQSGLVIRDSSVSELEALCGALIDKANAARQLTDGIDRSFAELSRQSFEAFNVLADDHPFLGRAQAPAKPMLLSEILSIFNLTGFYFPFTAEANVNSHMPQIETAFTACHELAHTVGFMREDEANFIGYLACLKSPDAQLQYSGLYVATVHSMNALYRADRQRYFALCEKYSPALTRDMLLVEQYWVNYYGTPAAEVSNAVNDTYLKANNLADGTRSYGRMVDLLLAEYRQAHGMA